MDTSDDVFLLAGSQTENVKSSELGSGTFGSRTFALNEEPVPPQAMFTLQNQAPGAHTFTFPNEEPKRPELSMQPFAALTIQPNNNQISTIMQGQSLEQTNESGENTPQSASSSKSSKKKPTRIIGARKSKEGQESFSSLLQTYQKKKNGEPESPRSATKNFAPNAPFYDDSYYVDEINGRNAYYEHPEHTYDNYRHEDMDLTSPVTPHNKIFYHTGNNMPVPPIEGPLPRDLSGFGQMPPQFPFTQGRQLPPKRNAKKRNARMMPNQPHHVPQQQKMNKANRHDRVHPNFTAGFSVPPNRLPRPNKSPAEASPVVSKSSMYEQSPSQKSPLQKDKLGRSNRMIVSFPDHSDDDFSDSDEDNTLLKQQLGQEYVGSKAIAEMSASNPQIAANVHHLQQILSEQPTVDSHTNNSKKKKRKRKRSIDTDDRIPEDYQTTGTEVTQAIKRIRESYLSTYTLVAETDLKLLEDNVQQKEHEKLAEEEVLKNMEQTLNAARKKLFTQQQNKITLEAKRRMLEEQLKMMNEAIENNVREHDASKLKIKLHEDVIAKKKALINELSDKHDGLSLELYEIRAHNTFVSETERQRKETNLGFQFPTISPLSLTGSMSSLTGNKPGPSSMPSVQAESPPKVVTPQQDASTKKNTPQSKPKPPTVANQSQTNNKTAISGTALITNRVNSPQTARIGDTESIRQYIDRLEKKKQHLLSKKKEVFAQPAKSPSPTQQSAEKQIAVPPPVVSPKALRVPQSSPKEPTQKASRADDFISLEVPEPKKRDRKKKKKREVDETVVEEVQEGKTNLSTSEVFPYFENSPPIFFMENFGQILRYPGSSSSFFGLLRENINEKNIAEQFSVLSGSIATVTPQNEQYKSINNGYESPLMAFRSYRLSPAFQKLNPEQSLVSSSLAYKINSFVPFCRFEMNGVCDDPDCKDQHIRDYKLTNEQIIKELLDYNGDDSEILKLQADYNNELQSKPIQQVAESIITRLRQTQGVEFSLTKFAQNRIRHSQTVGTPIPKQDQRRNLSVLGEALFDQNLTSLVRKQQSSVKRFFEQMSLDDYEVYLKNNPNDITYWIKHSMQHIVETDEPEVGVQKALCVLSRALEIHRTSTDIWTVYLNLYASKHNTEANINQLSLLYQTAVQMVGTSSLYLWLCYIAFEQDLNTKLNLIDKAITNFSVVTQLKRENEETTPINAIEYRSRCVATLLLEKVRVLCLANNLPLAIATLKTHLSSKNEDLSNPIDVDDDLDTTGPIFSTSHKINLWIILIGLVVHQRFPLGLNLTESLECADHLSYLDRPIGIDFSVLKAKIDVAREKLNTEVTRESILRNLNEQDRKQVREVEQLFKQAFEHFYTPYAKTCLQLFLNHRTFNRLLHNFDTTHQPISGDKTAISLWEYHTEFEINPSQITSTAKIYGEALTHHSTQFSLWHYYILFILRTQKSIPEMTTALFECAKRLSMTNTSVSKVDKVTLARFLYRRALRITYDNIDERARFTLGEEFLDSSAIADMQEAAANSIFLWLNYIIVELLRDSSGNAARKAFEEALFCFKAGTSEREKLWQEYIEFMLLPGQPEGELEKVVDRCLREEVKYHELHDLKIINALVATNSQPILRALIKRSIVRDYTFQNVVLKKFLSSIPDNAFKSDIFESAISMTGNPNTELILRWAEHELRLGNVHIASKILDKTLESKPHAVDVWKR
jgi:hypothetical protein